MILRPRKRGLMVNFIAYFDIYRAKRGTKCPKKSQHGNKNCRKYMQLCLKFIWNFEPLENREIPENIPKCEPKLLKFQAIVFLIYLEFKP